MVICNKSKVPGCHLVTMSSRQCGRAISSWINDNTISKGKYAVKQKTPSEREVSLNN